MLARASDAATDELYLQVLDPSATLDAADEAAWNGWYRFSFPEAPTDPSSPVTTGATAAPTPELRVSGMDLLTVLPVTAAVSPADAAFQVVSDDRHLWCFRASATGTVYLNRLALTSHTETVGESEETRYALEPAHEARYQRSGLRDVALDDTDTWSTVDLTGAPFLEPTIELTTIGHASTGRFAVTRVPTATAGAVAWYVAVSTGNGVHLHRFTQTDDTLLIPADDPITTLTPSLHVHGGSTAALTVSTDIAPAVAFYAEHDTVPTGAGTDVDVPRQGRLLVTVPVSGTGLGSAMAVYDFCVGADGQISVLTAEQQVVQLVDGTLREGTFTPDRTAPFYPTGAQAADCVQVVDGLVVNLMLLGQVAPAADPAVDMLLRPGDDGLVHLYYGGPPVPVDTAEVTGWHALVPGQPQALVAHFDPRVSRLVLDLPWAQLVSSEQPPGAVHLAARAAGAIMTGTTVTVSPATFTNDARTDQSDLCDLTISYPAASHLPSERWVGLPRQTDVLMAVLNGGATDDSADPSVTSGARPFFDFDGLHPQLRLPLSTGVPATQEHTAYAVLTSTRTGVPLRSGSVGVDGDTARLELRYTTGSDDLVQVWSGLPTNLAEALTVLSGSAATSTYDYTPGPGSTPLFALPTTGSPILTPLLLLPTAQAPGDIAGMTIDVTVSALDRALLDVHFAHVTGAGTIQGVRAEVVGFVADLGKDAVFQALGLHVDATGAAGTVALTRDPAGRVDLRDAACLFDLRQPPDLPDATTLAASTAPLSAGRQRHTFEPAQAGPSRVEMIGLVASGDVPDDGAPAYILDTPSPAASRASRSLGNTAAGNEQPRSGVWLRENPHQAVTFDGTDSLLVPILENGHPTQRSARLRPSPQWTLETWLQPTGRNPQRVITFADTTTPVAADAPALDYRVALDGQDVLDLGSYDHGPGVPDSSYAQGSVSPGHTPLPPDAFTWEVWVQPDQAAAPRGADEAPLGGILAVEIPGFSVPAVALGLRADRRILLEVSVDGSQTTPYLSQGALPHVDEDDTPQWNHVALRGTRAADATTWTVDLVVNAVIDATFTDVTLPAGDDGATVVIGSKSPYGASVFGKLTQLRLWSTRRSIAEIRRSAFVAVAGTEPGLLGAWPLTAIVAGSGSDRFLCNVATTTGAPWDALVVTGKQPLDLVTDDVFLSVLATVGGLDPVAADALLATGRWNHLAITFEAGGALDLNPRDRTDAGLIDSMSCAHSDDLDAGSGFSIDAWLRLPTEERLTGTIAGRWAWDEDPHDQSYRFGVTSAGELTLELRLVTDSAGVTDSVSTTSEGAGLADGKVHHVAVTFRTAPREQEDEKSTWTVTFWVDGKPVGTPETGEQDRASIQVQATQVEFLAGRGVSVPAGAAPQTLDSLRPLRAALGRLRFWGSVATKEDLFPEEYARWPRFGPPEGLAAQWDFLEQEGRTATDTIGGNDGVLSSSAPWQLLRDTSTMTVYANGAMVSSTKPYTGTLTPSASTGWWIGASDGDVRGLSGDVASVTLWDTARTLETIQDQQFTPRFGTEADLLAGWTFSPGGRDITGGGNDITVPTARNVPSTVPVTIEGAVTRAIYGGVITERSRSLADRPAIGSAVDVQRLSGRTPAAVVKRTYVVDASESPDRPIYVGDLALVWVGQVQTDPTLIGFIEGAPPVPSENLTRPYYLQPAGPGYMRYLDTATVSLVQQAGNQVSYTSSTNDNGSLNVSAALGIFGTYQSTLANLVAISDNTYEFKNQVQARFAFQGQWGTQDGTQYDAAWTAGQRDTLGISGDWEPYEEEQTDYLNPQVGRRFVPDNLGCALVESLTADLYAVTFAATGQALGTVVVPNPTIPPDRNILMFPMNKQNTLAGCLDGKIGLVNDPAYPSADRQRGSFYKPIQGYALAEQITREAEQQRAYAEQLDVESLGKEGDASLTDVPANLPVDFETAPGDQGQVATGRSGLVNRYTWSADGGLHTETQTLAATTTKSFSGFRSLAVGGGISAGGEFYLKLGWAWSLDLLGTHTVEVTVGHSEGLSQALSLEVTLEGEAYLRAWDPTAPAEYGPGIGAFLPGPAPGKVRQYRFMSIYLPPRTANASAFDTIVDHSWKQLSNDPTARALREIDSTNPVWRVLHRVTYVERIPPSVASGPLFLTSPVEREPVNLTNNATLLRLIDAAIPDTVPISRISIGAAVAAVMNPAPTAPGTYPPAVLELHISWWSQFLQRARPDPSGVIVDPAAATALAALTRDTVDYAWAGYATHVLPISPEEGKETPA
ncbi:hypothetical protein GA707_19145 [Nostocoides sp. F2B08]|uniref:LamG-like jellyroll fold domain-containing protein n=1 Tax=Nostocoides sp. F2B08 TaxID=2653936 RepID=UPI0012639D2E|nr:LamG-like jellyroll fold domain-containing protein [Tetrasphaera sp. F2B08]KAB7740617.1 hypothetical protein GA707_19145 [Tetrasphaera sp. F2B08]